RSPGRDPPDRAPLCLPSCRDWPTADAAPRRPGPCPSEARPRPPAGGRPATVRGQADSEPVRSSVRAAPPLANARLRPVVFPSSIRLCPIQSAREVVQGLGIIRAKLYRLAKLTDDLLRIGSRGAEQSAEHVMRFRSVRLVRKGATKFRYGEIEPGNPSRGGRKIQGGFKLT